MKTKIQIKSYLGNLLFEYESENNTIKKTLEKSCKDKIDLRKAYLGGADLQGADLQGADLQGADLRGADLRKTYLGGADLQGADLRKAYLGGADLRKAYLCGAYLQRADLRKAYLGGADLQGADLRGAYLQGADLRKAYLCGAYLQGADLRKAKNIKKEMTSPLYFLREQVNPIRAYKLVKENFIGIYNGGLKYEIGQTIEEKDFDSDETNAYGKGINIATLDWCLKEFRKGMKILVCEFEPSDIVAIPIGSDGKFRVKKCKVLFEKKI